MRYLDKSTVVEAMVIIAMALVIGVIWNRTMLFQVLTGQVVTGDAITQTTSETAVPLPLGLMQVKDSYDRQEAIFVDAREPSFYRGSHISRAVSLPLAAYEQRLANFRRRVSLDTPLIAYCNGFDCHDSMELGKKLLLSGYKTVFVYGGGIPEWKSAGYPVTGGDRE